MTDPNEPASPRPAPRNPSDGATRIEESGSLVEPQAVESVSPVRESAGSRRFRAGQVLNGKYQLERMIAKGGMGCVYLATQIPLGRKVAIKILIPQSFDDEFRRRFLLEASTCARLTHRHIVTVHDYGETEDGDLFTAMEFLDGEPLSRVIAREVRLSPERTCAIAIQTARALRSAHRAGVVHRDLKPSNIVLLRDDEDGLAADFVKVLDFGLVKIFESAPGAVEGEDFDLTRAGTMLGSPRYMAPEQIRCQSVDPRTDVYSFGVILFHLLAGRPPFVGQGSVEILNHHLRTPPPAIRDVSEADCPPELEVIVQRCLAKRAGDRYPSMDELLDELKAAYRLVSDGPIGGESSIRSIGSALRSGIPLDPRTPSRIRPALDPSSPSLEQFLTGELPVPSVVVSPARPAALATAVVADDDPTPLPPRRRRSAAALVLLLGGAVAGIAAFGLTRWARTPGPATGGTEAAPVRVEFRAESVPGGAEVWLEDERLGLTPLLVSLAHVAPGQTRTFEFRLEGHAPRSIPVRIEAGLTTARVELSPSPSEPMVAPDREEREEARPALATPRDQRPPDPPTGEADRAAPVAARPAPARAAPDRPTPARVAPKQRPPPPRRAAAEPEPSEPLPAPPSGGSSESFSTPKEPTSPNPAAGESNTTVPEMDDSKARDRSVRAVDEGDVPALRDRPIPVVD